VEPLALAIRTPDHLDDREVYFPGYPAFHAIGKGGGFHKLALYFEFPAMDAEPAMLHGLPLLRQALHGSS
jgi:hypothetical protein